jgi:hypothetical protein
VSASDGWGCELEESKGWEVGVSIYWITSDEDIVGCPVRGIV